MNNLELFNYIITHYQHKYPQRAILHKAERGRYNITIYDDEIVWGISSEHTLEERKISLASNDRDLSYTRIKGVPGTNTITYVETHEAPAIVRQKLLFILDYLKEMENKYA